MNTKKLKIIFILIEFIFGIAVGLLFGYLWQKFGSGLLNEYYFKLFLNVYIGIIIGVGIPGFIYTKMINKPIKVLQGLLFSTIGLILFLFLYFVIIHFGFDYIPYKLTAWILPVILPMFGALIGFNIRIDK